MLTAPTSRMAATSASTRPGIARSAATARCRREERGRDAARRRSRCWRCSATVGGKAPRAPSTRPSGSIRPRTRSVNAARGGRTSVGVSALHSATTSRGSSASTSATSRTCPATVTRWPVLPDSAGLQEGGRGDAAGQVRREHPHHEQHVGRPLGYEQRRAEVLEVVGAEQPDGARVLQPGSLPHLGLAGVADDQPDPGRGRGPRGAAVVARADGDDVDPRAPPARRRPGWGRCRRRPAGQAPRAAIVHGDGQATIVPGR